MLALSLFPLQTAAKLHHTVSATSAFADAGGGGILQDARLRQEAFRVLATASSLRKVLQQLHLVLFRCYSSFSVGGGSSRRSCFRNADWGKSGACWLKPPGCWVRARTAEGPVRPGAEPTC